MQLEGKAGLSILEACDAARVSRAGFYRHFDEHLPRHAVELLDPSLAGDTDPDPDHSIGKAQELLFGGRPSGGRRRSGSHSTDRT